MELDEKSPIDGAEPVVCASIRLRDPGLIKDSRMLPIRGWAELGSTMELAIFSSYQYS